jgi:tetratricopeptide (TPR) repeat protein
MKRRALLLALAMALTVPTAAYAGELAKARGHMESGQYQDAIPVLEKFTKSFPNEPRGWSLLAECYQNVTPPLVNETHVALGRKDSAQNRRTAIFSGFTGVEGTSVYQRLVQDEPQDVQNNMLLAISLILNDHDLDAAKKQLDKLGKLGVGSDLKDAHYNVWGLYFLEQKNWEQARKMFNVAKRSSTFALGKLQEVDKAEAEQNREREAAENDPARIAEKRFNELMAESRTMVRESRNEAAVDLLEEAVRLKPGDVESQTMLNEAKVGASADLYWDGKKLVDSKRYAEAYDKFDRSLQLDPTNASASIAFQFVKKELDELDKPQVIRRYIPGATYSVPVPNPEKK